MRVLHVIGKLGSGGIENFVVNLYRHIDRMQLQFDFVVFRDIKEFYDEEIQKLGGRKIVLERDLRGNLWDRLNRMVHFYIFLKRHPEYPIIHIHMSTPSSQIEFVLIAKALGRKTIAHAHASGDYRRGFIRKFIYALCRSFLWNVSDEAVACSEEAAEWLFSQKYSKKARIIHNGIEFSKFVFNKSVRHDMRVKYGLEKYFVIGHIGRFAPEKNQEFLLEIIQELKGSVPLKLLLVGDGAEKERVKKLTCEKNLDHEVIFTGESHEAAALLQAMDIFLLPSLYEGLGIVALEAQAAGLPCILSDGVPMEVKCTGACEFLSLNAGAEKWAHKILEISKHKERQLKEMEIRNIRKFDVQNIAYTITDLYVGGGISNPVVISNVSFFKEVA